MSQTKTESSEKLPEQMKDSTCVSFESTSSSTDAEPSSSNKASFKEDEAEGARCHFSEPPHSPDLSCVGSNFDHAVDDVPRRHHPRKRSLDRSKDFSPKKQPRLGEGVHDTVELEVTEGDRRGVGEDTSGTADTDDETIGHTQDTEAEAEHSAVALEEEN